MTVEAVVDFAAGRKVYFVSGSSSLQEVSTASKVSAASKEQFEGALATLGDLISTMEKSLESVAKKPKKVEMEFGASIKGNCDLWIVSGEGNAAFKVTLTWES